jgi:hypothetical protein
MREYCFSFADKEKLHGRRDSKLDLNLWVMDGLIRLVKENNPKEETSRS